MPNDENEHIGSTFRRMDMERSIKKQKACDYAEQTIPSLFPREAFTGLDYTPESEEEQTYPHSSLPARGITGLAAKLTAGILPMTNQPFVEIGLRPSDIDALQNDPEAKSTYARASKLLQDEVYHTLAKSNLRSTFFQHFKRLAVLGDDMIRQKGSDQFELHRFDNYVVKRDMKGDVFYAILRQYAQEHEIPEEIRQRVTDNNTDSIRRNTGTLYPLYTIMERKDDGSWDTSQHFSEVKVPDSDKSYTANNFPFYFSRWSEDAYDNYGSSLVEENYGDLLTAQAVRQSLMDGYSIATMGFVGVRPGSLTVNMVKNAKNWDPLPVDDRDSLMFIQPQNVNSLTAAETMDQRMSSEIRRIFHMDVSAELTHDRTTATQVLAAKEELNKATGGLLAAFDASTLKPIILATIHSLVDEDVFDQEIIDLIEQDEISIDVKSGVNSIGRESEYQNVLGFVSEIGQVVPGAAEMISVADLVRWGSKARGIPNEIIKTDEQLSEERQADLQGQLADQLVEQAPKTGGAILEQQTQNEGTPRQ